MGEVNVTLARELARRYYADDSNELTVKEESFLVEALRTMLRSLVADINRTVGQEYLFLAEFAGMWALFAKREGDSDRRVGFGFSNTADLSKIVDLLQKVVKKEMEI